jgi:hypothetical protein
MTYALLILLTGFLCIACFITGAKLGQTVSKGKEIELPSINPVKAYKENQARKQADMKQNKLDTILRNIERYDGTPRGQEEVK